MSSEAAHVIVVDNTVDATDREWVIADFKGMIKDTVKIFPVEQDKAQKAVYMARAVWDAVFNRFGQRVPL